MISDYAKKCEKSMMMSSIVILILGLILAIEPSGSIKMLSAIIALLFIGIGCFQLICYIRLTRMEKMMSLSLILGIVLVIIGICLLVNIESLAKFITLLIGLTIGVKSLFKLQFALNIRDLSDKWCYNLFIGLFGIALAILVVVNPFASATLFMRIIGIVLVLSSVIELIETNVVLKTIKEEPITTKKDTHK